MIIGSYLWFMMKDFVLKGEKLIAELLGRKWKIDQLYGLEGRDAVFVDNTNGYWEAANYSQSIDRLIPAWVKISKMIAPADGEGITMMELKLTSDDLFQTKLNYRIKFKGIDSEHRFFEWISEDPLDCLFHTTVHFLEWLQVYKKTWKG